MKGTLRFTAKQQIRESFTDISVAQLSCSLLLQVSYHVLMVYDRQERTLMITDRFIARSMETQWYQ